jgi:hypothetical protein
VPNKVTATHANITEGPGEVNFHTSGDDVHVVKLTGTAKRNTCEAKFIPFPNGN